MEPLETHPPFLFGSLNVGMKGLLDSPVSGPVEGGGGGSAVAWDAGSAKLFSKPKSTSKTKNPILERAEKVLESEPRFSRSLERAGGTASCTLNPTS